MCVDVREKKARQQRLVLLHREGALFEGGGVFFL